MMTGGDFKDEAALHSAVPFLSHFFFVVAALYACVCACCGCVCVHGCGGADLLFVIVWSETIYTHAAVAACLPSILQISDFFFLSLLPFLSACACACVCVCLPALCVSVCARAGRQRQSENRPCEEELEDQLFTMSVSGRRIYQGNGADVQSISNKVRCHVKC